MILPRLGQRALRGIGSLCALTLALMLAAAPDPAAAQGRLEAHYEATLAGIPVGRGAWTVDISEDQFSAAASGGTMGLLNAIAGGSGTGAAQGRVVNGALVSTNYTASTTTSKKTEAIHINLVNGNIKDFGIEPEPPVDADRIPVTDAHRHGVYDPMTGSMLRVAGTADPVSPEACQRGAGGLGPDDGIEAPGRRDGGSGQPRGLPHRRWRLRRPHALRSQTRFQAHGNR